MKKLLSFIAAIVIATTTFAQVDEVTLTTIGTGKTEEEATLQALRSAIEQSFGTLVSANTTILNDKLVQDEIVSVSNGNVKEYQKLAVATMQNGQVSVSAKVTVSVNKLITYAKSKGSRAEFAGQAFSANLKVMQLRAKSTKKTIELMMQQLDKIAEDMFDFKLLLGDPIKKDGQFYFQPEVEIYSNIASTNFYNLLYSTLGALQMSKEDIQFCRNSSIPFDTYITHRVALYDKKNERQYFTLPLSHEECVKYGNQLYKILSKGYTHFTISEIGDPNNQFICSPLKDRSYLKKLPQYKCNQRLYLYDYEFAYIKGTKVSVWYNSDNTTTKRVYERSLKYHFDLVKNMEKLNSSYCLTEERIPIKLTKQQQKEVKKGTFAGKTYTVKYTNPQLLMKFATELPAANLESGRFQGFEIKSK